MIPAEKERQPRVEKDGRERKSMKKEKKGTKQKESVARNPGAVLEELSDKEN